MKTIHRKTIAALFTLIAGTSVEGITRARDVVTAKPEASKSEATTAIPATVEGIWQAIDQKTAELQTTIRSGKLSDVHHLAFAVRDLVAALPAKLAALTPEQQARVRGSVKFVATLADRLDASGDANDSAATQDNFAKLQTILKSLRSNYAPQKAQ